MCHLPPRKNFTHEYQTDATPDQLIAALGGIGQVLPAASSASTGDGEVRVEAPGFLITMRLRALAGGTRIVMRFKSCAKWAWMKLVNFINAKVRVRFAKENAPACVPVPNAKISRLSVPAAVNLFIREGDNNRLVVFSAKAMRQAEACVFWNGDAVLENLRRLVFAARRLRDGEQAGNGLRSFFVNVIGLRGYRPRISYSQLNRYREDYVATYDGEEFLGHMHVTIGGANSEAGCMSIHWAYCAKRHQIIILRCGKHGRTARN